MKITLITIKVIAVAMLIASVCFFFLIAVSDFKSDANIVAAFITLVTGAIFGAASAFYQEVLKQNP